MSGTKAWAWWCIVLFLFGRACSSSETESEAGDLLDQQFEELNNKLNSVTDPTGFLRMVSRNNLFNRLDSKQTQWVLLNLYARGSRGYKGKQALWQYPEELIHYFHTIQVTCHHYGIETASFINPEEWSEHAEKLSAPRALRVCEEVRFP